MRAFAHFRVCGGGHSDSLSSGFVSAENTVETISIVDDIQHEENASNALSGEAVGTNATDETKTQSNSEISFSQNPFLTTEEITGDVPSGKESNVTSAVLTDGWSQCGTCEWQIDVEGKLTIRPLGGAKTGTLASWTYGEQVPWSDKVSLIKTVVVEDGVIARTCGGMFLGCSNLTSADLTGLKASSETENMFLGCPRLETIILPAGADYSCSNLHDIAWKGSDGSIYDTTSEMLFANAQRKSGSVEYSSLTSDGWSQCGTCEWQIDVEGKLTIRPLGGAKTGTLEKWHETVTWKYVNGYCYDTPWWLSASSIKSVVVEDGVIAQTCFGMFAELDNVISIDLTGLDTSSVTNMSFMFVRCKSLKSITGLSTLDTSRATDMRGMFSSCSSLRTVDLSGLNASSAPDMSRMFSGCNITSITLPASIDFSNTSLRAAKWVDSLDNTYTDTTAMLAANTARKTGAETYTSVPADWAQSGTCEWQIDNDGKLTIRPIDGAKTGTLASWTGSSAPWSSQCTSITSVVCEGEVITQTCGAMFSGCENLVSIDLTGCNTSNVTDMGHMFFRCSRLASVNVTGLDMSSVTDMSHMFYGCSSLAAVPMGLTIPANAAVDKLFYVDSQDPITTRYYGEDKSIIDYDWASDNRKLRLKCTGECIWDEGVVTKTPTCTEPGEKTVTCSVCGYVQEGVVIEVLGHAWADPEVEFVNNNTSARATWTCANDVTHKHTEECTVSKTEQPATCFERGKIVYMATAIINGTDASVTKTASGDTTPAMGHNFNGMNCTNCGTHLGDANGNGVLNIVDAQIAYDIAAHHMYSELEGYAAFCAAADVTGENGVPDGYVDAQDAFRIQYVIHHGWES